VLLDAIREFSGTVLFVSHDRYFIDGLATRVFEVEERRVHIYPGNYEDYLFRKNGGLAASAEETAKLLRTEASTGAKIDAATGMLKPVAQVGKVPEPPPPIARTDASPETWVITSDGDEAWESTHEMEGSLAPVTAEPKHSAKRLNPIKLKQIEDRVAAIENELSDLDARILQAEQQQAVYTTAEAARAVAAELDTLREEHAARTAEWEGLASQLEEQTTA
jgi:ATP-binding cassette subfamily F protein 3